MTGRPRPRTKAMHVRLAVTSAVAVVMAAGFLPASGLALSAAVVRGPQAIPAGLAAAIHARLGAGAIRPGAARAAAEGPSLGASVALSADGTTALVGAPNAGPLSTVFGVCCHWRNGAAYVFHVSSAGSWSSTPTPTATLRQNGAATFGAGSEVALSPDGTTAFVGAPSDGSIPAIYVFHVAAEDAWASSSTPTAKLTVPSSNGLNGPLAVSTDGTTLVASAPFYNAYAPTAFVFHVSSESAWATSSTPTAALTPPDDGGGGGAVAISGDGMTVLVSDSANYVVGGRAYLYHVAAESAWTSTSTPTAILTDASGGTGTDASDALGHTLALSGDGTVALLGTAPYSSKPAYVDVFRTSSAATWVSSSTPTATLTKAGGSRSDDFGSTVALSNDGTTALVRAAFANAKRGADYIFKVAGEAAWASSSAPTARLTNSGDAATQAFSDGVLSADGATALVGTPGVRWWTGAAEVFHVSDSSSWVSSSAPKAMLTVQALAACVVPKLKGLTVPAAKSALKARSCRLGKVSRVHAKGKRGRVFSQSAKPGSRLRVGAKVGVKVAK